LSQRAPDNGNFTLRDAIVRAVSTSEQIEIVRPEVTAPMIKSQSIGRELPKRPDPRTSSREDEATCGSRTGAFRTSV
jgi:hypothetical protein